MHSVFLTAALDLFCYHMAPLCLFYYHIQVQQIWLVEKYRTTHYTSHTPLISYYWTSSNVPHSKARLAQSVEARTPDLKVLCSTPECSKHFFFFFRLLMLLIHSACMCRQLLHHLCPFLVILLRSADFVGRPYCFRSVSCTLLLFISFLYHLTRPSISPSFLIRFLSNLAGS